MKLLVSMMAGMTGAALILGIFWLTQPSEHSNIFEDTATERTAVQPKMPVLQSSFNMPPQGVKFEEAASKTVNAVVHIRTEIVSHTQGYNDFFESFREYMYGNPHSNRRPNVMIGFGSGVVLSEDGYIVTNNHVVEGAESVSVTFNDNTRLDAEIIGTDPSTDLALIKVDAEGLDYLVYGNSDDVKIGEWVLAVGNPFNLTSTVTAGIVSAKARNINILGSRSAIESFIQTDAAVNRGNSGGALVNTSGELVGINAAIASRTGAYEGYSFAIPVNIVRKVVDDLMRYGETQRAYIGVEIREMNADLAAELETDVLSGVYVARVAEGGGAEEAGMDAGDIITSIDGHEVQTMSQLLEIIGQKRPGDRVNVGYVRDNDFNEVLVTLLNRDGTTGLVKKEDRFFNEQLGVTLEQVDSEDKRRLKINSGLRVRELSEGVLSQGGINEGFVIVSVNGQEVNTKSQLDSALANANQGLIRIQGVYPNGMRVSYEFSS